MLIKVQGTWVNKLVRYAQAAGRVAFASAHSRA